MMRLSSLPGFSTFGRGPPMPRGPGPWTTFAFCSAITAPSLLVEVAAALSLAAVDFLIDRVVLQQFLVGAEAVDLAVVQHEDAVGILHRGNALCNDDLGGAGDLLTERLPDLCVGGGIHGTGGVVEDEDLRLAQQGAGDGQTLFLTAGDIGSPSTICSWN